MYALQSMCTNMYSVLCTLCTNMYSVLRHKHCAFTLQVEPCKDVAGSKERSRAAEERGLPETVGRTGGMNKNCIMLNVL